MPVRYVPDSFFAVSCFNHITKITEATQPIQFCNDSYKKRLPAFAFWLKSIILPA